MRECEVSVKMGDESIEEVVDKIQSQEFWQVLVESHHQHDERDREVQKLLDQYQDEYGKGNVLDESQRHADDEAQRSVHC